MRWRGEEVGGEEGEDEAVSWDDHISRLQMREGREEGREGRRERRGREGREGERDTYSCTQLYI